MTVWNTSFSRKILPLGTLHYSLYCYSVCTMSRSFSRGGFLANVVIIPTEGNKRSLSDIGWDYCLSQTLCFYLFFSYCGGILLSPLPVLSSKLTQDFSVMYNFCNTWLDRRCLLRVDLHSQFPARHARHGEHVQHGVEFRLPDPVYSVRAAP